MADFTLKLDLTRYERDVLVFTLRDAVERAMVNNLMPSDRRWSAAIEKVLDQVINCWPPEELALLPSPWNESPETWQCLLPPESEHPPHGLCPGFSAT